MRADHLLVTSGMVPVAAEAVRHWPYWAKGGRAGWTHWCVLTMAVKLIWLSWMAFLRTGATL